MRPICLSLHGDLDLHEEDEVISALRLATETLSQCLSIAGGEFQVDWDAGAGSATVNRPEEAIDGLLRSGRIHELVQLGAEPAVGQGALSLAEVHLIPGLKASHEYELVCTLWFREPTTMRAAAPFESALQDSLRSLVNTGRCVFGCISDDTQFNVLPLEDAQIGSTRQGRSNSRSTLRNYSWVTFVSAEIAEQLSRSELESSAYRVEPIEGKGMLVQFTPSLEEFTGEAIRRAHHVLAPATPEKPLKKRNRYMSSYRIVWDDGVVGPAPAAPEA